MQLAALHHVSRAPLAYPVGEDHLRVVLKAARGDLVDAVVIHGDRFSWPPEKDEIASMAKVGDDGVSDYWAVTIPSPKRKVRYLIYVEGVDGSYRWISEMGIYSRRPGGGHFQYAYIHRADLLKQPEWVKQAVFYQIFPDRFYNGDPTNDPEGTVPWGTPPNPRMMAGGDIAGIRQKLGYLKELGVTTIYTTPLFKSPSNHKYDTTDYYQIDPVFGTNEEFKALVSEAHEHDMRFLLDAVFNHSGLYWPPFQDVLEKGEESAYKDWFYNLQSFPVKPEECNYETFANGIHTMPKLATDNPECAAYLLDVAEHWIRETGMDGWRLDVANEIDHGFWRKFRDRVKAAKPDAFILGETWHESHDWLQGDQFDSVMNYPWREATLQWLTGQIDAQEYDQLLTRLRFMYTPQVWHGLLNLLGTHDTARIVTELGSKEKAALAAVLLMTAPGVPMIYYGDEIGMEGPNDPGCRGCYPWDDESAQDRGMLELYRRLAHLRQQYPWLNEGAWESTHADPVYNLLGFRRLPTPLEAPDRPDHENAIYVLVNNAARSTAVEVPGEHDLVDVLDGLPLAGKVEGAAVTLPPYGAAVLMPRAMVEGR